MRPSDRNITDEEYLEVIRQMALTPRYTYNNHQALGRMEESLEGFEFSICIAFPEIIRKHRLGHLITTFERMNLMIQGINSITLTPNIIEEMYGEYGERVVRQILDRVKGTSFAFILGAKNLYTKLTLIKGYYVPMFARIGTIRAEYGESLKEGIGIHCSVNSCEFEKDLKVLFPNLQIQQVKEMYLWSRKT